MIELNLLPEELKVLKKERTLPKFKLKIPHLPMVPLAIAGVSIFIAIHIGIALFVSMQNSRLIKLNAELKAIDPRVAAAEELKDEADRLSKKYSVIDSLTSGSLVWSKKLYDLVEAVTDGIWLTSLYLQTKDERAAAFSQGRQAALSETQAVGKETMVLEGSAVSSTPGEETAIVGKFIKSLKSHSGFFNDFEDIKLSSIQRKKVGDTEVMNFTVVCYFRPGRSYFEKLKHK